MRCNLPLTYNGDNPLEVPEDRLADIQVLETIKEGLRVYRRE